MKKQKIRAQEAVDTLLPNGINLVALTFYCVAEYVLGAGGEGQNLPTEFNLQESLHFWTVLDGTVTTKSISGAKKPGRKRDQILYSGVVTPGRELLLQHD